MPPRINRTVQVLLRLEESQERMNERLTGLIRWFVFGFAVLVFSIVSTSMNFKKIHNMGSDRVSVLAKNSYKINVCNTTATAISVQSHGRQFGVTIAHFNCNGTRPEGIEHCEGLDVSLDLRRCTPTNSSLDASTFTNPIAGDEAVVYGFGAYDFDNVHNYQCTIGGEYTYYRYVNSTPFNFTPILRSNSRYLVETQQRPGFSGSCVLNGYGLIGLVTALHSNVKETAIIVPWEDIDTCIGKAIERNVIFPSNCHKPVDYPPNFHNFIERKLLSISKKYTIIQSIGNWVYNNF